VAYANRKITIALQSPNEHGAFEIDGAAQEKHQIPRPGTHTIHTIQQPILFLNFIFTSEKKKAQMFGEG
jgi:hypothetical protein